MSTPAIALEGLWFSHAGRVILEDVNLELGPRESLAILGPNGSGKSTLLKVILGLLKPDRGSVRVLGETPQRAHGHIAYVAQRASFVILFHPPMERGLRRHVVVLALQLFPRPPHCEVALHPHLLLRKRISRVLCLLALTNRPPPCT